MVVLFSCVERDMSSRMEFILERDTINVWDPNDPTRRIGQIHAAAVCFSFCITIHKLQGTTLDNLVIVFAESVPIHMSALWYVALSRVRTLDGLYIVLESAQANKSTFAASLKQIRASERAKKYHNSLKDATRATDESDDAAVIDAMADIDDESMVNEVMDSEF